jgi:acetoacetyl-CoA synthetase
MRMSSDILWNPPPIETTPCGTFIAAVNQAYGVNLSSYQDLYAWSISDYQHFWEALWTFGAIIHHAPYGEIISHPDRMWPVPTWFEGAALNFAENLLEKPENDIAIISLQEPDIRLEYTYKQLKSQVAKMAAYFKKVGLQKGDVVAAFITNGAEAVVGMLAAASLGAIWTSCSPDAGAKFAGDRFHQTHPKLLMAVNGYLYDGKIFDLHSKVKELADTLPTLIQTIWIERIPLEVSIDQNHTVYRQILEGEECPIVYTPLPFSHPLYILYSSGTTGKPKAIVHSAGGTLLQHIKEHQLQCGLAPQDKLLYYTSTSWMMWNWLVSGLASGITIVLFEGKPDPATLWKIVEEENITCFGTSAPWISLSQKSKIILQPSQLQSLRVILSTGAPLLREHFDYVYTSIKPTVQLASISGGTDIVSCFAGGAPVPIVRGRLQAIGLGMAVEVWDDTGKPVYETQGELVCTKPFPCMPVYFLNDPENEKYKTSYFDTYPGIWAHGDFAIHYPDNSLEIIGRSDSTIKRHGVRIGTSDIYNTLEHHPDIQDCLAVGKRSKDNEDIVLFVKVQAGVENTVPLRKDIRNLLTAQSPWLKPDYIFFVKDIPYTSNGKKSEVLIKNLLNGKPLTNVAVLKNPDCLGDYEEAAKSLEK